MKRAFSLIELILVMVILSIVASIGTDIIRSLFDNYATTARVQNLEMQANNTADMIANRLEHRIAQTAAVQRENSYYPLAGEEQEGSFIFYRRAYELERNFATYIKDSNYAGDRYSGFVTNLSANSDFSASNVDDNITISSKDSNGAALNSAIDLSKYEVFFNDDDSLFYKHKIDENNKENIFKRYYDSTKRPFFYGCTSGSIDYDANSDISIQRSGCELGNGNLIRPSMARLIHKIYFSNEVNRIRLDAAENKLYLDICDPIADKTCTQKKEYLLADNVSVFKFTALGNDENIASGIVFKICLALGDNLSNPDAQVCQTRVVR